MKPPFGKDKRKIITGPPEPRPAEPTLHSPYGDLWDGAPILTSQAERRSILPYEIIRLGLIEITKQTIGTANWEQKSMTGYPIYYFTGSRLDRMIIEAQARAAAMTPAPPSHPPFWVPRMSATQAAMLEQAMGAPQPQPRQVTSLCRRCNFTFRHTGNQDICDGCHESERQSWEARRRELEQIAQRSENTTRPKERGRPNAVRISGTVYWRKCIRCDRSGHHAPACQLKDVPLLPVCAIEGCFNTCDHPSDNTCSDCVPF
jgi:hypothetical protein